MQISERREENPNHPSCPVHNPTEAKLRLVPPSGELIERETLLQQLAEAPRAPFVLISAPVGYGKSALLVQWFLRHRAGQGSAAPDLARSFSAITLDSGDDNPVALWAAVVHALMRLSPDVEGGRLLQELAALNPDIDNVVLPGLLKEIDKNCPRLILALDNYQEITDPECHEQVNYLLNQLPAQACLVLATRTDPPLPLARIRASGDILELRMSELRFTSEEVAQVLRRVGGHQFGGHHVGTLLEHTEGWPAAVHLAARLVRNQPNPAEFLRCFGGNNRYVLDYLSEEVLCRLSGEVQRFLARTSILDRFTAPLCDAVAGTTGSADLLDGLERSNLFLIPLDAVRTWYRYHGMFGQALREQLARTEPGIAATLHEQAGSWFERSGRTGNAIGHALAAGAAGRASGLVARHWAQHLYRGELATVRGWLSTLGAERIGHSPPTALCAAWSAALSGERLTSHRWLRTAEQLGHRGALPDGMHSVRGAVALFRSAFGFGGIPEMLVSARIAADLHQDVTVPWYAQARVGLGYGHYLADDTPAAVRPLERAAEASIAFPVLRVLALSTLSLVVAELGRPAQAADLALAARDLVRTGTLAEFSETILARVAYAAALAREGHLVGARQELEQAVRLRRTVPGLPPWPTLTALLLLARVVLTLGDRNTTRALLAEASDLLQELPDGGADRIRTGLAGIERKLAGAERSTLVVIPLTDREHAVLRLLQGDLSLREVAAQLFITANTVKSHTRLIYRKLGVSSRAEAIRRARERGLL
jgi:LuxR family transcriptional regulator, maltose regulon positive regulatory protein